MTAAGAILLGTQNMGEYAYDFTGENAHYGPSRNPLDTTRMSGGSSGGSAAAVAAGMVPLSLGSDTNGSIRVPSAFCGLYGLKPTYGRLPRTGTFPFCESLDHLGSLRALAQRSRALLRRHSGLRRPRPGLLQSRAHAHPFELGKGADGLRIGSPAAISAPMPTTDALAAVDLAAKALGVSREIDVTNAARARAAAFLITNAESSTLHLDRLRHQAEPISIPTRAIASSPARCCPPIGTSRAQRFRREFEDEMRDIFKDFDVLLAPSTPFSAPLIGQKTMTLGGREVPLRPNIGIFTQPISFIGLPVAAVPVYSNGPMPFGVQVIGKPWREDLCLRVAATLEAGVR